MVPVLRAGLGMVDAFLRLLPDARVGHLGLYRDEETHEPFEYYERLPPRLEDAFVFVVDPMLATGGSAVHALDRLKAKGARQLSLVCLVVAPEGLTAVAKHHPDVPVWTAALDRELDENATSARGSATRATACSARTRRRGRGSGRRRGRCRPTPRSPRPQPPRQSGRIDQDLVSPMCRRAKPTPRPTLSVPTNGAPGAALGGSR